MINSINSVDINEAYIVEPSHPVLSQIAEPVRRDEISSRPIQDLISKMMEIAGVNRENPNKSVLVGLAAPQIGISKQIILVDIGANGKGGISDVKVYINPKIIDKSDEEVEWYEGCFSTGNVTGIVKRAQAVTISALNEKGEEVTERHSGYVARIFQHEIDHLYGKRFPSLIEDDEKLHWVEQEEFPLYRNKEGWRNWPNKCPREKWEEIQRGQ
jgi:peptide deformylase